MESETWKHYKKIVNEEQAMCNYCSNKLSIKGSTTSGLIRHLQAKHNISIKNKQNNDNSESSQIKKSKIQPTLDQYSSKKSTLSEIVAELAATDGISLHAITNSKFIRQSISDRGYVLPKNKSDVMNLVKEHYNVVKCNFIKKIELLKKENIKFSITVDEWCSNRNRRYINVNLHYSDKEVGNLGLVRIEGSCPAEKFYEIVQKRL
jgi:hypothetical protein